MGDDETRVVAGGMAVPKGAQVPGSRVGAYRLLSLLGKGGMGEVWLAERADAAYSKQVAIKFISNLQGNREAAEWFRRERQALARLEHPNIARLLDGGESEEGMPFLVMEYVDGVAIDQWCEGKPLESVLELFLQVCSAVEHAHRALIVHRDIKPANVLVTAEGQSRLLDFGIAKEMEANPSERAERTTTQAYTLHYASPEQMEGRAITVASDIYSLGALLYRLLSGRVPHAGSTSALGQLQAIQTTQPRKPSRVVLDTPQPDAERRRRARRLDGDLDDIVLKCLRREPELRYGSARELSEDIERYRTHQPVLARKGSAAYRASRYLRRHWLAIAAAAAVLLSLAGGLWATQRQALEAERQRALAQKRFDLSRALVNDVLFDFQDRLATVPGTIDARRHLVGRTREYLRKLAVDAQSDPGLLIDLALAERRLGDIAGNPNAPNIGDSVAARSHYQRAVAMARRAVALRPDDAVTKLGLARVLVAQATFLFWASDFASARAAYNEAIPILARSAASEPALERELAAANIGLGDVQFWNSELEGALATYERACRKVLADSSGTQAALDAQGTCRIRRADALAWLERYDEAEADIAEGVKIYVARQQAEPGSSNVAHSLFVALIKQGEIRGWHGRQVEALESYGRALQVAAASYRADAEDQRAARDLALARSKRGDALLEAKRFPEAMAEFHASRVLYEQLWKRDPAQSEHERDLAFTNKRLGATLIASGDAAAAVPYLDAELAVMRQRWQKDPKQAMVRRDLAIALEDRMEAPASRAQRCEWAAENRRLLLGLKQDKVSTPADEEELQNSAKRMEACPR